jgi:hypothetical protein
MGSTSSVNPGVSNLLQSLSNINSPVLSSSKVVSALESAPTSDIVQLSQEATQLQTMESLFGLSDSSSSDPGSSILAGLTANAQSSSAGASTASSASQLANLQTELQSAESQGLFGDGTTGSLSNSLLDTIA